MKLLSIIIPHYNSWRTLKDLLNSIPNNKEIEILVIDDHSVNYEENIPIFKEKYPYITFLKNHSDKKGAGAARNVGLSMASGEWLLFADADDLFTQGFYKVINDYFSLDYDLIYFKPTSFVDRTLKESTRHTSYVNYITDFLNDRTHQSELRLRYKFEPPWTKLIKHQIIRDNNIQFKEIMVSNDTMFSTKVGFYSKKITASNETIYSIRERNGSLTSDTTDEKFKQRFRTWLEYVEFLQQNLTEEDYKMLNISAIPQFLTVKRNKLGYRNMLHIINNCRVRNIPIIDKRLFNLKFFLSKVF